MYSRFLSLNTASGNPARLTAKASGNGMYFRCVLLRFSSDKRNASCLRTQHDNSRAPSLRGYYSASSLLRTPPTPNVSAHRVMDSPTASGLQTPTRWLSQVPQPFCRYAPSALTPMGPSGASADCFPESAGFIIFGRLATHHLCFEAVSGSPSYGLRLAASLSNALTPSLVYPYTNRPRSPCSITFARQAATTCLISNYMAISLQIARMARLSWRTEEHEEYIENSSC